MKTKNISLLGWLAAGMVCFLGSSLVHAQESMGYIDLHFCGDNGNHLEVTLASGQTSYDICMNFTNGASETMKFRIDLVEGEVAYGDHATKACGTAPSGYFGKNVVFSGDGNVTLPPGGIIEKHALFTVPPGYAGTVHGCITYREQQDEKQQGMLAIVTRKANLIDITVPGEIQSNFHLIPLTEVRGNEGVAFEQYGTTIAGDEKLRILRDAKKPHMLSILAGLRNDGYADEEYQVSAQITSLFGAVTRKFTGTKAGLYADQDVMNELSVRMPRYEGWMKVAWQVEHRPTALSGEVERPWQVISKTNSFFLIEWYMVVALACILLLIIGYIYRRRRRKRTINNHKKSPKKKTTKKKISVKTKSKKPASKSSRGVSKSVKKVTTSPKKKTR